MNKPSLTLRLLPLLLAFAPGWAAAMDFEFHPPPTADDPSTPAVIRDLAERILPVYQDADIERYLANLSALQLADSNYAAADDARISLRERQKGGGASLPAGRAVAMDLYAHARTVAAAGTMPLAQAFTQSYRETVPKLGDQDAYAVAAWLTIPPSIARDTLQAAFDSTRAGGSLSLEQAIDLIWDYLSLDARRNLGPQFGPLIAADDQRRYQVDGEVLLSSPSGAEIHIRTVLPKGAARKRTALFEFMAAPGPDQAVASAAHGYAGVVAYSRGMGRAKGRGKGRDNGGLVLFKHEGEDARAVIRWITRQPWSDGRVGMYGEGYSGFTAWSAARRLPGALKAIATADAMAPGIDFPAPGRVFRNAAYPWALASEAPDGGSGGDPAQWRELDRKWYRSGKAYRQLDRLGGARSENFERWLAHPSYDRFWQRMIPFERRFAGIGIPVLSMSGYYADGEPGALYYFSQHRQYRKDADHTLLIGPYDDSAMRDGVSPILRGHAVDAAALIDLRQLRLQWFDHVFKGSAMPALLQDRVNYEVMGANEWRHASSLEAMGATAQRYYLAPAASAAGAAGSRQRLAAAAPADGAFIDQSIDFKDRRDADWTPPAGIAGGNPAVRNGLSFVSEPLQQATTLNGAISGRLDFKLNRMDLDLQLTLYELLPGGGTLRLSDPYQFRASYAGDRVHRRLLKDGERQQLPFSSERLGSRKLQPGSRLLLLLEVNKRPDQQINYGGGGEVSGESVAAARRPLRIRWYGGSYIELPLGHQAGPEAQGK